MQGVKKCAKAVSFDLEKLLLCCFAMPPQSSASVAATLVLLMPHLCRETSVPAQRAAKTSPSCRSPQSRFCTTPTDLGETIYLSGRVYVGVRRPNDFVQKLPQRPCHVGQKTNPSFLSTTSKSTRPLDQRTRGKKGGTRKITCKRTLIIEKEGFYQRRHIIFEARYGPAWEAHTYRPAVGAATSTRPRLEACVLGLGPEACGRWRPAPAYCSSFYMLALRLVV